MTNKANGVYYTPSPVVDYIVRGTLSPLLEGKSPMQIAGRAASWEPSVDRNKSSQFRHQPNTALLPEPRKTMVRPALAVLDPACGTGNFLLGAYQFLLDWCLQWYREHDPERWLIGSDATLCRDQQSLRLSPAERQRVLQDHIFGVDIDTNAVRQAKRSLYLQMQSEPHASPECIDNIRVGNSLIDEQFDWNEHFPDIMSQGGFDATVGNPPYVNARILKQEQGEAVKRYYRERYRCARRAFDLYVLFVERSHELLRPGGRAGFILPNKIATLDYARPCRELLLTETTLDTITDVSAQNMFQDANVYPYIITWTKKTAAPEHSVRIVNVEASDDLLQAEASHVVRQTIWSAATGITIHKTLDIESRVATRPLSQCGTIHSGTTGFSAEQVAETLVEQGAVDDSDAFDFIVSGNIDRYSISRGDVRFMKRKFTRPVLPMTAVAVSENKRKLYATAKIVIAGMSRRLEAAFDPGGLALGVQVYAIAELKEDARFLLGVLNSRLMSHLLRTRFRAKRLAGDYLAINKSQLVTLPIRIVNEDDLAAVAIRHEIIESVDGSCRMDAQTDRKIDRLVYQLYAITEEEIETIEQSVDCREHSRSARQESSLRSRS